MPLVDLKDMLGHARAHGYAVGAYDAVDSNFVAAIVAGAEAARAPVVVSFAESHFAHYDFPVLMAAAEATAKKATIPVALFPGHGSGMDVAVAAMRHDAGLSDEQFQALVASGVAKINYYTVLSDLAAAAASNALADVDSGYVAAIDAVRAAVADEVARTCAVFGAAGRADELLAVCRPHAAGRVGEGCCRD
jgi:fructose/tagatose bisphosphate aldolase